MASLSGSFGGTGTIAEVPGVTLPVWVRMVRVNANFVQSFWSQDGVLWNDLGGTTVNTGTLSTFLGLANSAYNASVINTSTFDNVLFTPKVPCVGNADSDASVAFSDITSVLANLGSVYPPATVGAGDANFDLVVNFSDITSVLANLGRACP